MNLVTKKQNGVIFTPEWVADFMVDEILASKKDNIALAFFL